jgi:hypothetical protein
MMMNFVVIKKFVVIMRFGPDRAGKRRQERARIA